MNHKTPAYLKLRPFLTILFAVVLLLACFALMVWANLSGFGGVYG